jgi:undecaprenyl-diphosphatase
MSTHLSGSDLSIGQIILLALVQGLTELLPVSSSAHVIIAEKLLGLDPTTPRMTLLLVLLHTGTMVAVIVYFWDRWRVAYFQNWTLLKKSALSIIVATILTAAVGGGLILIVKKFAFHGAIQGADIEVLFGRLELISPALACTGLLVSATGLLQKCKRDVNGRDDEPKLAVAGLVGMVQGLCLPFRGFSRSGATISVAMLAGVGKARAEAFSFALAIVLTPPIIVREVLRLFKSEGITSVALLAPSLLPSIFGAVVAFVAGLLALKWLNTWLETGRWYLFGIYCLVAAVGVGGLAYLGY